MTDSSRSRYIVFQLLMISSISHGEEALQCVSYRPMNIAFYDMMDVTLTNRSLRFWPHSLTNPSTQIFLSGGPLSEPFRGDVCTAVKGNREVPNW